MEYSFSNSWSNAFQALAASLNDWGSLHPVFVHIPIGALFIAPLFILLGLLFQRSAKTLYMSALILLVIGTSGIFLAVSTGEKASESIKPNREVLATLEAHDHLAGRIRLNFSILTGLFMAYVLSISSLVKKFLPKVHRTTLIIFLVIYAYNLVLLFNTAHQGGKLVHRHGITSKLYTNVYH